MFNNRKACVIIKCEYIYNRLVKLADNPNYIQFCHNTYVIPPREIGSLENSLIPLQCVSSSDRAVSFRDILNGFVADCIRKYPNGYQIASEQNILALGYRSKVNSNNKRYICARI